MDGNELEVLRRLLDVAKRAESSKGAQTAIADAEALLRYHCRELTADQRLASTEYAKDLKERPPSGSST